LEFISRADKEAKSMVKEDIHNLKGILERDTERYLLTRIPYPKYI